MLGYGVYSFVRVYGIQEGLCIACGMPWLRHWSILLVRDMEMDGSDRLVT